MSKTVGQPMLLHLKSAVTSLSSCWKITRKDGVMLTFTDAQSDLAVDGLTYHAAAGFDPSAVESSTDMSVDNLEVDGLLDLGFITAADVAAGVYDSAMVEIFYVNRLDTSAGRLPLKTGFIGQIGWQQGTFKAEVRGLLQPFQQNIVEIYTKTCRATLSDARCKVPLVAMSGTLATVTGNRTFTDPGRKEADKVFDYGKVVFTSGANAGYAMEVKTYRAGVVELLLPMPRKLAVGDAYTIYPGCDRDVVTCRDRFANILNFRGEPHVPDPAQALFAT